AARRRPSDLPRGGAQLLRAATGRGSPLLSAPPPQPLRRRGAPRRAGLAVRRGIERHPRTDQGGGAAAARVPRTRASPPGRPVGGRPPAPAGLPAAVRATPRRGRARVARAPVRTHPGRARLRPCDPRAPRRPAPVRQPPEARAARALLRGAPRRRSRGLRPLRRGSGGGWGEGVGRRVRGGGL